MTKCKVCTPSARLSVKGLARARNSGRDMATGEWLPAKGKRRRGQARKRRFLAAKKGSGSERALGALLN